MIDVDGIRTRYRQAAKFLDERGRRLFVANEALAVGYGGVSAASAATGLARSTIRRAIVELQVRSNPIGSRVRRPGGGRKRAEVQQPGLPRGPTQPGSAAAIVAFSRSTIAAPFAIRTAMTLRPLALGGRLGVLIMAGGGAGGGCAGRGRCKWSNFVTNEDRGRRPDLFGLIALVAVIAVLVVGYFAFPRLQRALLYQDCIASGRITGC